MISVAAEIGLPQPRAGWKLRLIAAWRDRVFTAYADGQSTAHHRPAPQGPDSILPASARQELTELFDRYRSRLRLMVHLRLDRRLQARVDGSDVLQEAFLEAAQRYECYKSKPTMPPFLWLRFLVGQRLTMMLRRHLGVKARTAAREVSLFHGALPAGQFRVAGRSAFGKTHQPQPRGDAFGAASANSGSPEFDGGN